MIKSTKTSKNEVLMQIRNQLIVRFYLGYELNYEMKLWDKYQYNS